MLEILLIHMKKQNRYSWHRSESAGDLLLDSPSCSVAMNQGQGKALRVDLLMMLKMMLNAYLKKHQQ